MEHAAAEAEVEAAAAGAARGVSQLVATARVPGLLAADVSNKLDHINM